MGSLCSLIILCVLVAVLILYVSPYKQAYNKYNKLDVAVILCLGVIFGGYVFDFKRVVSSRTGYTFSYLFSLIFLVYFMIKSCLFVKHLLVQKLSECHCAFRNPRERHRGDYENLNSIN